MTKQHEWDPVTPGTLQQLADTLRRDQRRKRLTRRAAITAGIASMTAIGAFAVQRMTRPTSLTCVQVRELSDEYVRGELPTYLASLVEQHRAICDECDRFLTTLQMQAFRLKC